MQRLIQKEEGLVEAIVKCLGAGSSDVRTEAASLMKTLFGELSMSLDELLEGHSRLVLLIDQSK